MFGETAREEEPDTAKKLVLILVGSSPNMRASLRAIHEERIPTVGMICAAVWKKRLTAENTENAEK